MSAIVLAVPPRRENVGDNTAIQETKEKGNVRHKQLRKGDWGSFVESSRVRMVGLRIGAQ
jgi:hypothetical protein